MSTMIAAPAARLRLSLDIGQIAAWYAAGESTRDIGRRLGKSEKTVWRHMRAHGIPLRTSAEASPRLVSSQAAQRRNERMRPEILALAAGGMADAEISRRTGVPETGIRRMRRDAEIPPAPRRPTSARTPVDMGTALEMWASGATAGTTGAALGVTAGIIRARLAEKGCETGSRNPLERVPEIGGLAERRVRDGITARALAAELGVTENQVRAFAKKHELRLTPARAAQCGTESGYSGGCRCPDCKEAHCLCAQQLRADRAALVAAGSPDVPHGTVTGYHNWMCRCIPCKKAGSRSNALSVARRRIRQGVPVSALTELQRTSWLAHEAGAA